MDHSCSLPLFKTTMPGRPTHAACCGKVGPAKTSGLPKDSVANVSQMITVDRDFLAAPAGRIRGQLLKDVENGLRLVLAL